MRRQALQKADSSDDTKPGTGFDVKAVARLMERAQKGDEVAMDELRGEMGHNARFWGAVGDPAKEIVKMQLNVLCGDNLLFRETTERRLSAMREELAGPKASPLERLLADRIAVCWLQLQHADLVSTNKIGKGVTFKEGDYYQRWQDRAHRRFLSACKALATVRKLALPALQVNIGEKQVNIVEVSPHEVGNGGTRVLADAEDCQTSIPPLSSPAS